MKKPAYLLISMLTAILFLAMCTSKTVELPSTLFYVKGDIENSLTQMDSIAKFLAEEMTDVAIDSEKAREILNKGLGKVEGVIDVSVISTSGIITTMVPESNRRYEGSDISEQDHIDLVNLICTTIFHLTQKMSPFHL